MSWQISRCAYLRTLLCQRRRNAVEQIALLALRHDERQADMVRQALAVGQRRLPGQYAQVVVEAQARPVVAAPVQLGIALEMWVGENGEYRYQKTITACLNVADDDVVMATSGERLTVNFVTLPQATTTS